MKAYHTSQFSTLSSQLSSCPQKAAELQVQGSNAAELLVQSSNALKRVQGCPQIRTDLLRLIVSCS